MRQEQAEMKKQIEQQDSIQSSTANTFSAIMQQLQGMQEQRDRDMDQVARFVDSKRAEPEAASAEQGGEDAKKQRTTQ